MDYEKNAIEILRMIGSNNGFTVADSGGKDSSVLTHIAMKAGCPFDVVHNHTTVDAPETVYFIREKFKKLRAAGIKAEVIMPRETMWQLIIRKKDTTDKTDTVLLLRVKGKLWRRKENGNRSAEGGECKSSKEPGSSYISKAAQKCERNGRR